MINWSLILTPIKELKDHPKNPRQIKKEQVIHLQGLIEKFGLIDKPIVNQDMTIIGGHQRIRILKKMKVKQVECWVPDHMLTDDEIDHLCIGLNLNQGEFDFDILANQWEPLDLLAWGFTEEQLLGLEEKTKQAELEDDEEILEPPKEAKTKFGDLYELGVHRLKCGDSTNSEAVKNVLAGAVPVLMVTDPPYGVNYDPDWRGKAGKGQKASGKVKNDDIVDWSVAYDLFPGFVVYVWCASWYLPDVAKNLDNCGFERKSLIIWNKQNFSLSRGDYHWKHEPCWYAIKKGNPHNWQGSRKESTVWDVSSLNAFGMNKGELEERTNHSTQKPIECMARPIRNNTAEGEGVYDPFLGSGTTLISAEKLNRVCYGLEIDPGYCDIIVQRWCKLTGKKAKRNGVEIDEL